MGIIQGLTEFLPISSSGHLVLYQYFFGKQGELNNDISLEVFLHLGSLLAVVIYFRRDILELLGSVFQWKSSLDSNRHLRNRMVIVYLLISTLVTGAIYLMAGDKIETAFSHPVLVSVFLVVTGIIIFTSDLIRCTEIPMSGMGLIRSVIIGLGQGFAMLPGISRSGTTIAASLFCGVKRTDAARFSFLLSIPAILAANLSEFSTLANLQSNQFAIYLAGAAAAFISGYLVISILLRLIQNAKLKYFAFYCWFIAALSLSFMTFN